MDLTNQRFGRLTVKSLHGRNKSRGLVWLCECDCGNFTTCDTAHLRNGHTSSCGCFHRDVVREKSTNNKNSVIHGDYKSKLYNVWHSMKQRCLCTTHIRYVDYGGRGITICSDWLEYIKFKEWALNSGYKEGLTIERINNNGNYEPSNCRWATNTEQQSNKRSNRFFLYQNRKFTLTQIANKFGMSISGFKYAMNKKLIKNIKELKNDI